MSEKTVFLSYRRDATGKAFARGLKQELTHHGYDVFLDVDSVDAGHWAAQILTQVPGRSHFLLALTPGALDRCANENDWVRREFLAALEHHRNVVPVCEESVEISTVWQSAPECMQPLFGYQAATVRHATFDADIQTLVTRFIPPHKAPPASPAPPSPNPGSFKADLSRVLKYAPAELIGRAEELKLLHDAWSGHWPSTIGHQQSPAPTSDFGFRASDFRPHVLTLVALGGEGKTSLVAKWAAELAAQDWPGCDAAFAWSFYSQGTRESRDAGAASSDLFLKEALTFFGDDADKAFAASPAGAFEKGQRLARLVGQRRSLLILDGLEPLQYAPTAPTPGELKDQGIAALLKGLAATSHGLCVVTTRYSLPDLKAFRQTTAPEEKLLRLSRDAGVHLLKTLGVRGTAQEFATLVEDVKGHALTLTLLGGFLKRAFHGDIRQRDRVKFEKADEKMDGGHAFRTMAAYEQWLLRDGGDEGRREVAVLRLMGLFDRPADAGCLAALRGETISGLTEPLAGLAEDDWEFCLSGLETAKLLTVNRDASGALVSLDAHPHIREYFAALLKGSARASRAVSGALAGNTGADTITPPDQPAPPRVEAREGACATQTSDAWRAAHRRLYEHLCATTPDKPQPTLEDLQPLYQAVAHGCQATLYSTALNQVLRPRIQRGESFYSTYKLGAIASDLGALACFFEDYPRTVTQVLPLKDRAFIHRQSAYCLRSAGRSGEAVQNYEAALKCLKGLQGSQNDHATVASLLGELLMQRGDCRRAVEVAQESVQAADATDDDWRRTICYTHLGNALLQAAGVGASRDAFLKAEEIHQKSPPAKPLLILGNNYRFCDWLLANGKSGEVIRRLEQALHAEQSHPHWGPFPSGFRCIVLGCALAHRNQPNDKEAATQVLCQSLEHLRSAGREDFMARALLALACVLASLGEVRTRLDEAWEIAERGSMMLFKVDIHLQRARLFFHEKPYPWTSPQADLAAARKLIEQCGYWRRKEELEDAEKVIGV